MHNQRPWVRSPVPLLEFFPHLRPDVSAFFSTGKTRMVSIDVFGTVRISAFRLLLLPSMLAEANERKYTSIIIIIIIILGSSRYSVNVRIQHWLTIISSAPVLGDLVT